MLPFPPGALDLRPRSLDVWGYPKNIGRWGYVRHLTKVLHDGLYISGLGFCGVVASEVKDDAGIQAEEDRVAGVGVEQSNLRASAYTQLAEAQVEVMAE